MLGIVHSHSNPNGRNDYHYRKPETYPSLPTGGAGMSNGDSDLFRPSFGFRVDFPCPCLDVVDLILLLIYKGCHVIE